MSPDEAINYVNNIAGEKTLNQSQSKGSKASFKDKTGVAFVDKYMRNRFMRRLASSAFSSDS